MGGWMSGVEAGIDCVMTQLLRGHIVSSTVTKHKAVPSAAQSKPPHSAVLTCFCSPDVGKQRNPGIWKPWNTWRIRFYIHNMEYVFQKIHINQYNLCFICFHFSFSFTLILLSIFFLAMLVMWLHEWQSMCSRLNLLEILPRGRNLLTFPLGQPITCVKHRRCVRKVKPMWKYLKGVFSLTVFYWFKVINLFNYVPI